MSRIEFTYGAAENLNTGTGWLPYVKEDGRDTMNTWAPYGYSKEDAVEIARHSADEKASRFVGDWDISITLA
jgi:hypothetical protein